MSESTVSFVSIARSLFGLRLCRRFPADNVRDQIGLPVLHQADYF
jgi:hypothetical protein